MDWVLSHVTFELSIQSSVEARPRRFLVFSDRKRGDLVANQRAEAPNRVGGSLKPSSSADWPVSDVIEEMRKSKFFDEIIYSTNSTNVYQNVLKTGENVHFSFC